MIRHLTALFVMLAGVFGVAVVVMPPMVDTQHLSCNGVADYPVQRLADKGDMDAMTFLGQRLVEDGCDARMRAQGLRYLERAAAAGHGPAQSVLAMQNHGVDTHGSPVSACAGLLAMVLPGVDDPHLIAGACD